MISKKVWQDELAKLASENDGCLVAETVVVKATDPSHPLHEAFEWNDKIAGHRYRVEQANEYIRTVRIEHKTIDKTMMVPLYIRDPRQANNEPGYLALPRVRTDKQLSNEAIRQEFSRAAAALQRARDIAAALGKEEPIDDLLVRVRNLSDQAVFQ